MPETYGLPEDEPEEETPTIEQRVSEAIAGGGVIRRILLYVVAATSLFALGSRRSVLGVLAGGIGLIALLLLSFTDKGLSE